ncbi:hypothetical protein GS979_07595, partial [Rhodococcus hoagii]|nr:hypothetical protein [Prescottella equi]
MGDDARLVLGDRLIEVDSRWVENVEMARVAAESESLPEFAQCNSSCFPFLGWHICTVIVGAEFERGSMERDTRCVVIEMPDCQASEVPAHATAPAPG